MRAPHVVAFHKRGDEGVNDVSTAYLTYKEWADAPLDEFVELNVVSPPLPLGGRLCKNADEK